MSNQSQTISLLANMRIERQEYVFKFKKGPIDKKYIPDKTSAFGYRELLNPYTGGTRTGNHLGIDIVGTWHCPIKPIVLNGVVEHKWYVEPGHPTHGGYVVILHDDGWRSGYSHLSKIYVKEHDRLIDGFFYREINGRWTKLNTDGILGRQGNTGLSEGEHLHLTIKNEKGELLDPILYVDL